METHPNEEIAKPTIIPSYTLKLPSVWDELEKTEGKQESNEERIERKGKYAHVVLNSPLGSRNHTWEKELQHVSKEREKTLYGSYEISEGNGDFFSNLDLLQVMIRHIKQKDIGAF